MKKSFYWVLTAMCLLLLCSCGDSNKSAENGKTASNEQKTLTIWSWNIAAKGIKLTIPSFLEKHPNVKVEVKNIGFDDLFDKLTVALASGSGLPDIVSIESTRAPGYAENFPNGFWDMTAVAKDLVKDFDPSKWAQSMINEKIYSIPWDSGPVGIFYRRDYFKKAGVDANSIKTWDDFIAAGKKIEAGNPGVKLLSTYYTTDDAIFTVLMNQLGTFYFDKNGKITINSPEAVEAMTLIKKLNDSGVMMNTDSPDAYTTAAKNGTVATCLSGVWWGGTLKDQAPELSGKWGIIPMPAFSNNPSRAANYGGSTLAIPAKTDNPELAWEFVKNALANIDNQMLMFKKYDLFPSYLVAYKEKDFSVKDTYFDGQETNAIFAATVPKIKPAYYTKDYAEAKEYSKTAQAKVLTMDQDPKTVLDAAAEEIANATGRKIAKQVYFH